MSTALPKPAEVGILAGASGLVTGCASLIWSEIPFIGASLFGTSFGGVGYVTLILLKAENESEIRQIVRVALAFFVGIAAGMAASALGGYVVTLAMACELLIEATATTALVLALLTN
ncbi:MAG: hypothetical protein ACHQT8_04460 [Chlamydiales bacterium]